MALSSHAAALPEWRRVRVQRKVRSRYGVKRTTNETSEAADTSKGHLSIIRYYEQIAPLQRLHARAGATAVCACLHRRLRLGVGELRFHLANSRHIAGFGRDMQPVHVQALP